MLSHCPSQYNGNFVRLAWIGKEEEALLKHSLIAIYPHCLLTIPSGILYPISHRTSFFSLLQIKTLTKTIIVPPPDLHFIDRAPILKKLLPTDPNPYPRNLERTYSPSIIKTQREKRFLKLEVGNAPNGSVSSVCRVTYELNWKRSSWNQTDC